VLLLLGTVPFRLDDLETSRRARPIVGEARGARLESDDGFFPFVEFAGQSRQRSLCLGKLPLASGQPVGLRRHVRIDGRDLLAERGNFGPVLQNAPVLTT